jgi:hypothetical protein
VRPSGHSRLTRVLVFEERSQRADPLPQLTASHPLKPKSSSIVQLEESDLMLRSETFLHPKRLMRSIEGQADAIATMPSSHTSKQLGMDSTRKLAHLATAFMPDGGGGGLSYSRRQQAVATTAG